MIYNITLQYQIEADTPIAAQQKALANEVQPQSIQTRLIPQRPERFVSPSPTGKPDSK